MQEIQWTNSPLVHIFIREFANHFYQGWLPNSPLAHIYIQEFATNFYQGWLPCAIIVNLLPYIYRALWLNATTRRVFIVQLPRANASHIPSHLLCQT
jgi:hypothetical protein